MAEKMLVAYKAWRCKFCAEVRMDSTDMWRHLQEKHNIGSVESGAEHMYQIAPPANKEAKQWLGD